MVVKLPEHREEKIILTIRNVIKSSGPDLKSLPFFFSWLQTILVRCLLITHSEVLVLLSLRQCDIEKAICPQY